MNSKKLLLGSLLLSVMFGDASAEKITDKFPELGDLVNGEKVLQPMRQEGFFSGDRNDWLKGLKINADILKDNNVDLDTADVKTLKTLQDAVAFLIGEKGLDSSRHGITANKKDDNLVQLRQTISTFTNPVGPNVNSQKMAYEYLKRTFDGLKQLNDTLAAEIKKRAAAEEAKAAAEKKRIEDEQQAKEAKAKAEEDLQKRISGLTEEELETIISGETLKNIVEALETWKSSEINSKDIQAITNVLTAIANRKVQSKLASIVIDIIEQRLPSILENECKVLYEDGMEKTEKLEDVLAFAKKRLFESAEPEGSEPVDEKKPEDQVQKNEDQGTRIEKAQEGVPGSEGGLIQFIKEHLKTIKDRGLSIEARQKSAAQIFGIIGAALNPTDDMNEMVVTNLKAGLDENTLQEMLSVYKRLSTDEDNVKEEVAKKFEALVRVQDDRGTDAGFGIGKDEDDEESETSSGGEEPDTGSETSENSTSTSNEQNGEETDEDSDKDIDGNISTTPPLPTPVVVQPTPAPAPTQTAPGTKRRGLQTTEERMTSSATDQPAPRPKRRGLQTTEERMTSSATDQPAPRTQRRGLQTTEERMSSSSTGQVSNKYERWFKQGPKTVTAGNKSQKSEPQAAPQPAPQEKQTSLKATAKPKASSATGSGSNRYEGWFKKK